MDHQTKGNPLPVCSNMLQRQGSWVDEDIKVHLSSRHKEVLLPYCTALLESMIAPHL